MTTRLSLDHLADISANASVPAYKRGDIKPGILHFGVGNFHRAHMAVYLHELFNQGRDLDWGIIGAGVMPSDQRMRDTLKAQDFLTTVVEQDTMRSAATVTGPMLDVITAPDFDRIIATLADPAIRIVSMTITEGGYFIDPATGKFDPTHPAIVADAQTPDAPKTVFGLIIAGLKVRRAAGHPPFTVMCCDNIPGNGEVTEATLCGLAHLSDPDFAHWIHANVAFPNAMVDRITPATGQREIDLTRDVYGIEDGWPVFCEEFKQWVLEDKFPLGRPGLEAVGVTFVPDVAPYEVMKLRILNGGHAAIAYPAALLDIHFVHEAMEHPLIRAFLSKLEHEEIVPVVPPVPDTSLADYVDLIERRFLNPKIGDTIPRLAQDGSNRQPKFILPSTADRLAKGLDVQGLALVSALWCRYFEGVSDSGKALVFNDASAERLQTAALASRTNPDAFLGLSDIFGATGGHPLFRKRFLAAINSLRTHGTAATLQRYLDGTLSAP
ncbi:mannitol dehydrogenase [Rhizobium sp. Root274]|uniref:mannitol dehydrogenase family protein n=1 Tax=unclassified Rhizobium TaxID=2613769 RepID=UPI0007143B75|nr:MULTISPECIES: mannitol dehydrogenase family protein [unclassified Rhizobium]KQW32153.1 mannitol dehydrogenase [Rhizobium sp. Root1240]KRD33692.1 mannitol dehydrogenase [Rhizobium sp. Root274]